MDQDAAKSFKLNNPDALVYNEDCKILLKRVMDADYQGLNEAAKYSGGKLPKKGEVEILCGGPPCQGFSSMNQFSQGEYSEFKRSLIPVYLSVRMHLYIYFGNVSPGLDPCLPAW